MSNEMNFYGNYIEFDHAPTDEEILTAKLELANSMRDTMLMLPCFIIKDPVSARDLATCDPLAQHSAHITKWTVALKIGLFVDPAACEDKSLLFEGVEPEPLDRR